MEIKEQVFQTGTVALNYAEVIAPGAPLVLLQADPTTGGLLTEAEVEQAQLLLAHASHVNLSS